MVMLALLDEPPEKVAIQLPLLGIVMVRRNSPFPHNGLSLFTTTAVYITVVLDLGQPAGGLTAIDGAAYTQLFITQ